MNMAAYHIYMGYKKEMLVRKAKACKLDPTGKKEDLAKRIVKHESDRFKRSWDAISNGLRSKTI